MNIVLKVTHSRGNDLDLYSVGSLTLSLTTLAFSQLATYVLAEPILICKRSMMRFAF